MLGNFLSFMRLSKRLDNRNTISLNSTFISVNGRGFMINELEIGGNGINSIDDEISNYKIESENTKKELYNNHNRTMRRMNSEFNLFKNRIDNISFDEEEEEIRRKKQRIKELENERKRIDLDQTCIFDNSMNNRINKIDKIYNKKKEKINKLYEYNEPEPKFEYTEEEKERRQKDINEIRKLNSYSKHPYFNKMVNYFGLDDYL